LRTEDLIDRLSDGLQPVRRMASPWLQAAGWLAVAVAVIGLGVAVFGLRADLRARMAFPYEVEQWLASVAVGVLGALAAAMLAQPDRSWRWALLPLPALLFWMAALALGSLTDLARQGHGAVHMYQSWGCVRFILAFALPLTMLQLWVLRHAGPTRPVPVQVVGALASAALGSAGLSLVHHLDAALMILLWHGLAFGLVVLLGWVFGRRLLLRPVEIPR
jgi:hypothetical protein